MRLARIVGQVVSTIKEPGLESFKILVVEDLDAADPDTADPQTDSAKRYLAVDLVGAGEDEVVVIAQGSAARVHPACAETATDAAVVAIVDTVIVGGQVTFKK
jgi:ethanolamine utilization protein EutN